MRRSRWPPAGGSGPCRTDGPETSQVRSHDERLQLPLTPSLSECHRPSWVRSSARHRPWPKCSARRKSAKGTLATGCYHTRPRRAPGSPLRGAGQWRLPVHRCNTPADKRGASLYRVLLTFMPPAAGGISVFKKPRGIPTRLERSRLPLSVGKGSLHGSTNLTGLTNKD